MTSDAEDTLLADVCRTLARAGFDVAAVGDDDSPGLRVRQETDSVRVGWVPSSDLDPAGLGRRRTDRLQKLGGLVPVLAGGIAEGVPQQMHHAGLHDGAGPDGFHRRAGP